MSNEQKRSAGGGVSTVGVIQIVFIILKLCKLVSWSWWIVLSPSIIVALICIGLLIIVFILTKFD